MPLPCLGIVGCAPPLCFLVLTLPIPLTGGLEYGRCRRECDAAHATDQPSDRSVHGSSLRSIGSLVGEDLHIIVEAAFLTLGLLVTL